MAKFDAGTAVEVLEYDFTAYGGTAGVIPEPTTAAVNRFFGQVRGIATRARAAQASLKSAQTLEEGGGDVSNEEAMETLSSLGDEAGSIMQQTQDEMVQALAYLTGGHYEGPADASDDDRLWVDGTPTKKELQDLPFRVLQKFSEWLMGEINPKKGAQATKR